MTVKRGLRWLPTSRRDLRSYTTTGGLWSWSGYGPTRHPPKSSSQAT